MTDEQAVCIADTVPSRHVFFSCAYESSSSCGDLNVSVCKYTLAKCCRWVKPSHLGLHWGLLDSALAASVPRSSMADSQTADSDRQTHKRDR